MSCLSVFKEKGLRLTPQRRLIIELIHDNEVRLTAEDIINHVQARMPGVNKSTVYRTLDLLESAGAVYKTQLAGQSIYHHPEAGHHHHLVCSRCGRTVDCDEAIFAPVERSLEENFDFKVRFKHMVISGLCRECWEKGS
jgi:Fur family ferric uptake transcriptional regulator